MKQRIRILGVFLLLLFAVLFVQLNHIQLLEATKLANAPGNSRNLTNQFSTRRGAILTADGQVVAESVPSNDIYHFQRTYPHGMLYADVSGYDSIIYGMPEGSGCRRGSSTLQGSRRSRGRSQPLRRAVCLGHWQPPAAAWS